MNSNPIVTTEHLADLRRREGERELAESNAQWEKKRRAVNHSFLPYEPAPNLLPTPEQLASTYKDPAKSRNIGDVAINSAVSNLMEKLYGVGYANSFYCDESAIGQGLNFAKSRQHAPQELSRTELVESLEWLAQYAAPVFGEPVGARDTGAGMISGIVLAYRAHLAEGSAPHA